MATIKNFKEPLDEFNQVDVKKTSTKYSASLIEEIIDNLDILEILENEYDLVFEEPTNKGWYHTNCPMPDHRDSTPSFGVNPELKVFKCFGCQEKGNLLHFVRKIDGVSFNEAVVKLAALSGIDESVDRSTYRALKDINATVQAFLDNNSESKLPAGLSVVEYLRAIAERLREYEKKVNFDKNEIEWVDKIYKKIDELNSKDDQKGMSDLWSKLAKEIKLRYEKYQQLQENLE
jgi:DNA primase